MSNNYWRETFSAKSNALESLDFEQSLFIDESPIWNKESLSCYE